MAKKLSRKQRKLMTMKEMENPKEVGKTDVTEQVENDDTNQAIKNLDQKNKKDENKITIITLLIFTILSVFFFGKVSNYRYNETGNISNTTVTIIVFTAVLYLIIIPLYVKADLTYFECKLQDILRSKTNRVTLGWVLGLLLNIVSLTITATIIIGDWIYFVFNLNKGFWSIFILILPFAFTILTLSFFNHIKMSTKIWGISCGLVFGTLIINFGLIFASYQKNVMKFSNIVIFIGIAIISFLIYGIIKLVANEISIILKVLVFYIGAAIIIFNKSFDASQIITYDVTVTKKWNARVSGSGDKFMIRFDDGEQSLGTNKIEVLEKEYDCYEIGDHIRLLCRNGALGLPYVESYYEVE